VSILPAMDRAFFGGHSRPEALRFLLAVGVVTITAMPLLLAIVGSLRPVGTAPPTGVDLLPDRADLSNYGAFLGRVSTWRYVLNSLGVAMVAVPVGTLVASWAGFAIARLPRRSAMFLLGTTVVTAMMPVTSLFVGRLALFRLAGLTDSPVPLVAPALVGVSPLLVLLFAWSYVTIPRDVYDLAREVGLGPLGTWWRVAVPLRIGAIGAAVAVAFMTSWGNVLDPLLYIYEERWFTLPLGIASLGELPPTDQGLMLAAAGVATAPVLITAFVVQRFLFGR
jgi:multiple sugar transport system permease protein